MPASGNYVMNKGRAAGGAIAKKRFVKVDPTDDTAVVQCDSQGEAAYGVSLFTVTTDEIDLGKGCTVQVMGRAVVELGVDTAQVGDNCCTDASGKAMVATTGDIILGVFDEVGESVGDEASVLLSSGAGAISAGS